MIKYLNNDTVTLRGFDRHPLRFPFRVWLRTTDRAVEIVEGAFDRGVKKNTDATPEERNAKRWLMACWDHTTHGQDSLKLSNLLADWKARRHLLNVPPDPSNIIRCRCCNLPLSDPVSRALGIGPVCRDQRKAAVRLQQAEVAA